MSLEDVADTLSGGSHESRSAGSSAQTKMFKFFARMGGMRVEFIVHTNESYLNYMYQRGVSHDEYEVRRIFESGVAELLFPQDIYVLDMSDKKDKLVAWFRRRIEELCFISGWGVRKKLRGLLSFLDSSLEKRYVFSRCYRIRGKNGLFLRAILQSAECEWQTMMRAPA
jgi:hypothetical protein